MAIRKMINTFLPRTISRDLIFGLTTTLIIIISVVGVLYYKYAASLSTQELEAYADQVISEFSQNIAFPLSNFEVETVRQISKASLQAETLVGLSVMVNTTDVFQHTPKITTGIFTREKKVVWNGETVGVTKLMFTRAKNEKELKSLLTLMIFILSCVIMTIALATHLILKSFLNRPLLHLTQGIRRIADGNYSSLLNPVSHKDINIIVDEINRMSAQITKRSQQLAESEEKYRSIFESAVEGIYKSTTDGKFLDANPVMADILGYESPDELIRAINDIGNQLYVRAEVRQEFLGQLETSNTVKGFELEMFRKDGSRIWLESNARAIRNKNEELTGIEGFMVDISQRKQMEQALRQVNEELEFRVSERTSELEEKTAKLERINKLFVDRELHMKHLKEEIVELKSGLAEDKD